MNNLPSGNIMIFVQSCNEAACNFYKYLTNDFNIRVSESIDTKLCTCEIHTYGIEYLSGVCLLAHVGRALAVFKTNFDQHTPWLPHLPASLAAF